MAAKSNAALTSDNDNIVGNQTNPQSITPTTLDGLIKSLIDSMWNKVDDALTLPPINVTKLQLATLIGASGLNDQQQMTITDRTDGFPLIVFARGVNSISPFGIWVNTGKPLTVIMDYVNGYQGETNPFIAVFDNNRNFSVQTPIIIKDGTEGVGKVLVSDANGKTSWLLPSKYQSGILNPAAMGGSSLIMMGLAGAFTPTKSGNVLLTISGEMLSDDDSVDTSLVIKTGTGAAPSNGDAVTGSTVQSNLRKPSSGVARVPFSFNCAFALFLGSTYWIDLAIKNGSGGSVQLFNVSISILEQ